LFFFDCQDSKWVLINAINPPLQRTDHSFVEYEDFLYLYGGRDEMRIFSDLWRFNVKLSIWELV